jgi:hypothetical protein
MWGRKTVTILKGSGRRLLADANQKQLPINSSCRLSADAGEKHFARRQSLY